MKCHYIYTEAGEKVLIPGCMGTAAMGIENCTCHPEKTFAAFERERYNETVKALRAEVKDLEHENACLNRIIKNLIKHKKQDENNLQIPYRGYGRANIDAARKRSNTHRSNAMGFSMSLGHD